MNDYDLKVVAGLILVGIIVISSQLTKIKALLKDIRDGTDNFYE